MATQVYLTTAQVSAMKKALDQAGVFTIEKDASTIVAKHTVSQKEVLRGIKKSSQQDYWIVRHHSKLFA